jgi:ribonuclease III
MMNKSDDYTHILEKLRYTFKNPRLLEEAFRHASYVNERTSGDLRDNERLEFLGDAVLDLAISHILMDFFEDAKEGDLSKYRAAVVHEQALCRVAEGLKLGRHLWLGKGEELSKGRQKPSILANTLEALLGALYLDAGYDRTKEVINRLFLPLLGNIAEGKGTGDFKSLLQEFTQQTHRTRPEYPLIAESGPAHDKTFKVALMLQGTKIAEGAGKSKKEAEQNAAREAFICLTADNENL